MRVTVLKRITVRTMDSKMLLLIIEKQINEINLTVN
jgi:hypothetical protein